MVMGPTHWEQKRMWVQCPECRVEITGGSLLMHCQSKNVVGWGEQGGLPPPPPPRGGLNLSGLLPQNYAMTLVPRRGVSGGATNRTNLWVHFVHRHVRYIIMILVRVTELTPYAPNTTCMYHGVI